MWVGRAGEGKEGKVRESEGKGLLNARNHVNIHHYIYPFHYVTSPPFISPTSNATKNLLTQL